MIINLCVITPSFHPNLDGTSRVSYHNVLELSKYLDNIIVYTPLTISNRAIDTYPENISVIRKKPLVSIAKASLILSNIRHEYDVDKIHLHAPHIFESEYIYIQKKLHNQIEYVVTYHNDPISPMKKELMLKLYRNRVIQYSLSNAKKIIASSMDFAENSMIGKLNLLNNTVELPCGVDTNLFSPEHSINSPTVAQFETENSFCILTVGSCGGMSKGLRELIISLSSLENNEQYKLINVGNPKYRDYYLKLKEDYAFRGSMIFPGFVSDTELADWYRKCDLVSLLSTSTESFGIPIIEAMASGKPVISSNMPGVRTIIRDGQCGYVLNPSDYKDISDKISYLNNNPKIRATFGKNGRKIATEIYDWKIIGQKLNNILRC